MAESKFFVGLQNLETCGIITFIRKHKEHIEEAEFGLFLDISQLRTNCEV